MHRHGTMIEMEVKVYATNLANKPILSHYYTLVFVGLVYWLDL
jgi:hypothetical protein